jgi:RES domain-containing protein
VHLTALGQVPEYVCVKAHIPEDLLLSVEQLGPLPADWRSSDPIQARALGTKWLLEAQSAALRVPSAVIPREANYLLNPLHPSFEKILLESAVPFEFDVRLLGKILLE